jgi:IS5 family transposase
MRKNSENQRPLSPLWPQHPLARELAVISQILDKHPQISELVVQDLSDNRQRQRGAPGLSGEQVVRCAVLKNWQQFSYRRLAFHLADSMSFRKFCRLPLGWTPTKSCLQENIGAIRAATWEQINRVLMQWADQEGLEKGRKIRVDATAVPSPIHYPLDSQLLYDSIRKITALLRKLKAHHPVVSYRDHCRRAKRRCTNLRNTRGPAPKKALYRNLLQAARQTAGYAGRALQEGARWEDVPSRKLLEQLRHYLDLFERVMQQTQRRVLEGEKVPAEDKVVSIFEEHTDILQTGGRETTFGHKVFLTCGKTSLMLDCRVVRGNPADQAQMQPMLERHEQLYGRYPRQVSLDGGFAGRDNLRWAKKQGISDVAFAKKRGLKVPDMVRSSWVYRQLRRFRAGIEGCISMLKRVFGVDRCTWKGWEHFQQYVQMSVVSYNLLVLARLLL